MKIGVFTLLFLVACFHKVAAQHQILFCGEVVPMDEFVANKLMSIIRSQIPTARLTEIRAKTNKYFPWLEYELDKAGLPRDLKYLPIVESQFKSVARSGVGAAGLWQIMPQTGLDLGLVVNPPERDDRLNPVLCTPAACKLLKQYYSLVKSWNQGQGSWALACAAYNWGPGHMKQAIQSKGNNYYRMDLNSETANYVYKIIAIKELWEHPELYMKGFDTNLFSSEALKQASSKTKNNQTKVIKTEIGDVEIENMEDIIDPSDTVAIIPLTYERIESDDDVTRISHEPKFEKSRLIPAIKYKEVEATILKRSEKFEDGDLITIRIEEDLNYANGDFKKKGSIIKTDAWLIDGVVKVNLNRGILLYCEGKEGIPSNLLKMDEINIILKVPSK